MKVFQLSMKIPESVDKQINEAVDQLQQDGTALNSGMTKKKFVLSALENMFKDEDAQVRYFGRHLRQK